MYPCLNQCEWVSPLFHSQHKLDFVVGGGEIDPVGSQWLAKVSGAPEKKQHSAKFYQAPAQQEIGNGERSSVVV